MNNNNRGRMGASKSGDSEKNTGIKVCVGYRNCVVKSPCHDNVREKGSKSSEESATSVSIRRVRRRDFGRQL